MTEFSVVTCVDKSWGIGKNNSIPWNSTHDLEWFKTLTKNNTVIMGRNTWNSLPIKPLPNRVNIIVSNTIVQSDVTQAIVVRSLQDALCHPAILNSVFVIGGVNLYKEALEHDGCKRVYITYLSKGYKCDVFFPYTHFKQGKFRLNDIKYRDPTMEILEYTFRENNMLKQTHRGEMQYLDYIEQIMVSGQERGDRTGMGTRSLFGISMEYNLSGEFPLLTTKRVYWKGVVEELLWFLRGSTDVRELQSRQVRIWDGNSSREFLDSRNLTHYREGDIGPTYGHNFRYYGAEYETCETDYRGCGFDQVMDVLNKLRNNPTDRRMIINLWNPMTYDLVALPPCLFMYQFYVTNDPDTERPRWLSCSIYQRSGDMGLGVPFNIASASLLTYILAYLSDLEPLRLYHTIGDAHVYLNHMEPLKEQLEREPLPFPKLLIDTTRPKTKVEDFTFEDFTLVGYHPYDSIKMQMAV